MKRWFPVAMCLIVTSLKSMLLLANINQYEQAQLINTRYIHLGSVDIYNKPYTVLLKRNDTSPFKATLVIKHKMSENFCARYEHVPYFSNNSSITGKKCVSWSTKTISTYSTHTMRFAKLIHYSNIKDLLQVTINQPNRYQHATFAVKLLHSNVHIMSPSIRTALGASDTRFKAQSELTIHSLLEKIAFRYNYSHYLARNYRQQDHYLLEPSQQSYDIEHKENTPISRKIIIVRHFSTPPQINVKLEYQSYTSNFNVRSNNHLLTVDFANARRLQANEHEYYTIVAYQPDMKHDPKYKAISMPDGITAFKERLSITPLIKFSVKAKPNI